MTEIHLNLKNLCDFGLLLSIFPESNKYEFTSKKVFRLKEHVICNCGHEMVHNTLFATFLIKKVGELCEPQKCC